jgi:hypothetical protein
MRDTFVTLAKIAGTQVPQDRPIDGVDQTDFLLGKSDKSNREGFPVFVADRLEAVKWRNWKVAFYDEERDWWIPPVKLGEPKAFDLITDPKEEYPATAMRNTFFGVLDLEQDHRDIKRRIRASQHFRSFWGAWRTITGYEAIHMIRKGQACWSAVGAKVGLLHRFIVGMFGIEA